MSANVSGSSRLSFPMAIAAQGMCSAIGLDAPANVAAIRGRLNHFRETQFYNRAGQRLMGASLYEVHQWGTDRLLLMLRQVLSECWRMAQARLGNRCPKADNTALLVVTAEPDRPAVPLGQLKEAIGRVMMGGGFHGQSQMMRVGKGGVALALQEAEQLLQRPGDHHQPRVDAVMLVSADTLLDAPVIEACLTAGRMASRGMTDGFLPGEGAGCVMLMRPNEVPQDHVQVMATGHAVDDWRLGGAAPLRAQALSRAMRAAAGQAGCELSSLEFHVSGMSGEGWYSRELNMALSRVMEHKRTEFPHHMLAQFLGETGAAGPLLALAWLSVAMPAQHRNLGRRGLLHFAGDDGHRSAVVVSMSASSREGS